MRGRGRTLPLRVWLILVVLGIIAVSIIVDATLAVALYHAAGREQASYRAWGGVGNEQLAAVRQIVGAQPVRWRQATWQRSATKQLNALGVEAALFAGGPGRLVFATPGARRYLDTGGLASSGQGRTVGGDSKGVQQAGAATGDTPPETSVAPSMMPPLFARLTITAPAHHAGTGPPLGIALLWFRQGSSVTPWLVLLPITGVLTLALTLGLVALLMRRPVLGPLAALNEAVEGIAGGDLEVHLPSSPVREIAAVTTALEGMSRALGEALAQQAALEEERRLFVGAVAHDLRTPLFTLRAHLRGLQRGIAATPEKVREYVDECVDRAEALERLVAELFAFTRLEYLEQEPERAPLELGALLRQTVEGARSLAAAKGITLALHGPEEPCPLLGDAHLLSRVVENLLDNAVRHTPAGGEIGVRWQRDGDTLRFAVADTGRGIAAPDLPHLFTPLYRGESSRNRQTGGAGLGLAIAQRILRAHGGDLSAANAPTGGAVFTATLPLNKLAVCSKQ